MMRKREWKKSERNNEQRKLPLRIEVGEFFFSNGDKYIGEYAIDQKEHNIFRQGSGTYKTIEGHTYEGKWLNDKLVINAKVHFPDNSVYEGSLDETPSYAFGTYTFPDASKLEGDFKKFLEEGHNGMHVIDPNGHKWDVVFVDGFLQLSYLWNLKQTEYGADEEKCEAK